MLTGHVVVNDYASTADCNWTELHPVPPVCQAGTPQIHVQRLHQERSKLPTLLYCVLSEHFEVSDSKSFPYSWFKTF